MATSDPTISSRVTDVLGTVKQLTATERLVLAKLLLDSLVVDEAVDEAAWQQMGLAAFEQEWDNPDDAIYDNWRELNGIPAE